MSCNLDQLQRSLSDSLSERDEEQLAAHLNECEACRRRLEELAAGSGQWRWIGGTLKNEVSGEHEPEVGAESTLIPLGGSSAWRTGLHDENHPHDFAVEFLQPSSNPDVLGQLNNIEIRSVIGHGGNGIVLKGFQEELNRLVAVKVMAPQLATSAAARKRFAREAQATAAIVHPNVMPILTVHSGGQLPYLVMPYVDCESLQERLDREGQLPTLDILRISHQVANGLAAAHGQGLVHRDVKPANILLERGVDRVMLTDFGLARAVDDATLTRTGLIAGTPQYMSPEQARGDAVDTRSDLFSLGSVMYAMATGRPPFRAETSYGILRRVTDEEPRRIEELNSDIPAWLTSLISKLLAKSPDNRFTDADHLAELLEACIAHVRQPTVNPLPEEVRLETWGDRFRSQLSQKWRWGVRNPLVLLATVLLLLPLTLWLSGLLNNSKQEPKPQPSIAVSTDNDSTSENSTTNTTDELETEVAPIWHDDLGQQLNELDTEMETLLQSLQPQ